MTFSPTIAVLSLNLISEVGGWRAEEWKSRIFEMKEERKSACI
jgi:hypothetical protein